MHSLKIQSILYGNSPKDIKRAIEYTINAANYASSAGLISSFLLELGDCSAEPVLSQDERSRIVSAYFTDFDSAKFSYTHFGENLGSAGGHNKLAENLNTDLLIVQNPDVLVAPNSYQELLNELKLASVGMAEARQIPIEHGKDYSSESHETSWASTACAMVWSDIYREVNGFDAKSFFLYCDDVDFSWRIRLLGHQVHFAPKAAVFHDKRLDPSGNWPTSAAEVYYSAEGALMLAHKYSRSDLVKKFLLSFTSSPIEAHRRAAANFSARQEANNLPTQIDPSHTVSQFINGYYAVQRF
jgi:GT2 family glycosyltransferase